MIVLFLSIQHAFGKSGSAYAGKPEILRAGHLLGEIMLAKKNASEAGGMHVGVMPVTDVDRDPPNPTADSERAHISDRRTGVNDHSSSTPAHS